MEDSDRIVVEGVNQVIRHMRATRRNQQGGRVQKEAPIAVSNAMPICPRCDRGVRIRFTIDDQGVKARTCAKCGTVIGSVAPLRSE
jgi:large subunit ribosomal protein L24